MPSDIEARAREVAEECADKWCEAPDFVIFEEGIAKIIATALRSHGQEQARNFDRAVALLKEAPDLLRECGMIDPDIQGAWDLADRIAALLAEAEAGEGE